MNISISVYSVVVRLHCIHSTYFEMKSMARGINGIKKEKTGTNTAIYNCAACVQWCIQHKENMNILWCGF